MPPHLRHALATLAGIAALPGVAHAYVRAQTPAGVAEGWPNACVTLAVHLDDVPGISATDMRAAVSAAARRWTHAAIPCTSVQIALVFAAGSGPPTADDGTSTIGARPDGWCPAGAVPADGRSCNSPSDLASTSVFAKSDGRIVDADVQINTLAFTWAHLTPGADPGGKQDLEAALTHELGHVLGLAHPCWSGFGPRALDESGSPVPDCYDAPDDVQASAMYPAERPGDTARRTLSADDERALCAIYPAGATLPPCPAPAAGGCALGGRGQPPVAAALVAWLAFAFPRFARRRAPGLRAPWSLRFRAQHPRRNAPAAVVSRA